MPTADDSPLKKLATNTLGARLDSIFNLVTRMQKTQGYGAVWDCCCDHGYLGIKILAAQVCPTLYFVDQVPHIIEQLSTKLKTLTHAQPISSQYRTLALDASELSFPAGDHHLVILAGVGGEHIVDIVRAIETRGHDCRIDYLLCPTTTQFDLREYLVADQFTLLHESISSEKGRDYEVLLVRAGASDGVEAPVSLTGRMWDPTNSHHLRYREKLMKHYSKQTRGKNATRAEAIFAHYQQCLEASTAKGCLNRPSDTKAAV